MPPEMTQVPDDRVFDTTQLVIFDAVARHASMSRAARDLGYTQPAISHAIRRLERDAGTALLTRGARGVLLTEAGERLAAHAQVVLTVMRAARRELDELATAATGRVRLAAFPSAAAMLVPPLLARMRAQRPGLEVEVVHAEPDEALAMVRAGAADVAMAFAYPDQTPTPGIATRRLFDDEVCAVASTTEVAGSEPLELSDLAGQPWIAGCPRCRSHLIEVCRRAGFTPRIVHATDDYVAAQAMVAAGLGVTLLPALALAAYRHPDVTVHRLRPSTARQVTACTVAADPLPPAVAVVLDELRALRER
jgi:DNA-binding transcriptional LysR family regulator